LILRAFVAAVEQQDQQFSLLQKVDTATGAVNNSKLKHAIANGLEVSRFAKRQPPNKHVYTGNSSAIPKNKIAHTRGSFDREAQAVSNPGAV
jgi:hypothetical protein